jgi:hypothetical protein
MTVDLGRQQQIEGLSVFGDDNAPNKFYVMPDQPRFRIDDQTKKPVFKFIKYKLPVDRPDGKKGGGFVIFDSQFLVPPDKLKKIQSVLDSQVQARTQSDGGPPMSAEIDHIPFTSATASLTLLDTSGIFVSKVDSPGKPSVFGSMVCPFTAELTPEGATVIEAAMSGSGGVAQVSYDLHFPATFPPITGTIWFDASKFYSYYQSVDKSGGSWDSGNDTERDTKQSEFISSNSGNVTFDFSNLGNLDADTAKKVHDAIENWGWGQIDAATKAITLPDIAPAADTGDHGMDHYSSDQSTFEAASFYRTINEQEGISFETNQGGTLPNIVDMGFKWSDFAVEVDLNDPFFATISASVAVNADFDKYGINSVDVHMEYDKLTPPTVHDFHFAKPDDLGKFDSDTANGDMNYAYSFSVNYKDQSKAYQAPLVTTNHTAITINANDLGILYTDLLIGNVDFTKTPKVQVAVTYPDPDGAGQPISQQFMFDASAKGPQSMLAVILKPVDKPYTYTVTYILDDGTQMVMNAVQSQSSQIFINSPFVLHTFSFVSEGDFINVVDNIFLKMSYSDDVNKVQETTDFTFKSDTRQKDWSIPIVSGSKGTISYSGVITYKNHTTENLPLTSTTSDLIEFGPPNQVIVSVQPDATLIDFSKVKLVTVNLEYQDAANQIDLKQEVLLKQGVTVQPWTFYARDPTKTSYTWTAAFYMATTPPTVVKTPSATSSDTDLILMMPS